MRVLANPGRWVRIEGRVTVEKVETAPWPPAGAGSDEAGIERRLLVDGEPLDELIWKSMHVDPDDQVFGQLAIEVKA